MTLLGPVVPSTKQNEVHRSVQTLAGLLGILVFDLLAALGVAAWIGYVFPLWYLSRLFLKQGTT